MLTMAQKDFCKYVPRLHMADGQKPHLIGRPVWFDPPRRGVEQWKKKKKISHESLDCQSPLPTIHYNFIQPGALLLPCCPPCFTGSHCLPGPVNV